MFVMLFAERNEIVKSTLSLDIISTIIPDAIDFKHRCQKHEIKICDRTRTYTHMHTMFRLNDISKQLEVRKGRNRSMFTVLYISNMF